MNFILITIVTLAAASVDCRRRIHINPHPSPYQEFGQALEPTAPEHLPADRLQTYQQIPRNYHQVPPEYEHTPPEYHQRRSQYQEIPPEYDQSRYNKLQQNYYQAPREYDQTANGHPQTAQEYQEVTTYGPKRRRITRPQRPTVTTYRPNYPEVTTYRPDYPRITTYKPNYPEVTTYRPEYPKVTTYRPEYPRVTTYRPNYPEVTTYRPPLLLSRSQVFPEPETPKVEEQVPAYTSKANKANYLGKPVSDYEKMQAANAKYSFSTDIDDKINDLTNSRKEVRDGLKVTGSYSYSDGYFKRTVHYVADENGYRVTKQEAEPLDKPHVDPTGTASVDADAHGRHIAYKIQSVPVPGPASHFITDADDS